MPLEVHIENATIIYHAIQRREFERLTFSVEKNTF